ncbi:hypothetical protein G647_09327 [Cladophialophora carrionii CBS 160.54]|uniref:Uncharacterized protein n=1 Tax=Cladophialophora carrionii CBS 160.54 TaxID=1279043 RepID=V9CZP5_9EURO|nr:uncharacterized protein G647_09327 [Cladophialophora carrionii CBS 160.54]ETI19493.1 hypothetical protein G647_09327 [Cladophialophora carrionii CBS 160.54]
MGSKLDGAYSPPTKLPLWQHMYIALANSYFQVDLNDYLPSSHSSLGHIPFPLLEVPYVEGLMVCTAYGSWMYPMMTGSMTSVEHSISSYDLLEVRVKLDESVALRRISLDFCKYSPVGLAEFFEIDATVSQSLQELFDTSPMWSAYVDCAESLVPTLNQNLDRLGSVEIAQIFTRQPIARSAILHTGQPLENVIFSEGEFRVVGAYCRELWEEALKVKGNIEDGENNGDKEPEQRGEIDLALDEIVKALKPIWLEDEHLESEYRRRLYDGRLYRGFEDLRVLAQVYEVSRRRARASD